MDAIIRPGTPATAAACALLNVWLAVRIGQVRRAEKASIGDGGNPRLIARMRAQLNFVEYAPIVLILIGGVLAVLCGGVMLVPDLPGLLAAMLFLIGGGVFALYPVAVSHAADRAPAGALVRMSQGLLLINALGATLSPPLITPLMIHTGNAGLFVALAGLGVVLVAFFVWRRSRRPAPMPMHARPTSRALRPATCASTGPCGAA